MAKRSTSTDDTRGKAIADDVPPAPTPDHGFFYVMGALLVRYLGVALIALGTTSPHLPVIPESLRSIPYIKFTTEPINGETMTYVRPLSEFSSDFIDFIALGLAVNLAPDDVLDLPFFILGMRRAAFTKDAAAGSVGAVSLLYMVILLAIGIVLMVYIPHVGSLLVVGSLVPLGITSVLLCVPPFGPNLTCTPKLGVKLHLAGVALVYLSWGAPALWVVCYRNSIGRLLGQWDAYVTRWARSDKRSWFTVLHIHVHAAVRQYSLNGVLRLLCVTGIVGYFYAEGMSLILNATATSNTVALGSLGILVGWWYTVKHPGRGILLFTLLAVFELPTLASSPSVEYLGLLLGPLLVAIYRFLTVGETAPL